MKMKNITLAAFIFVVTVPASAFAKCVQRDNDVMCEDITGITWYTKSGAVCSFRGDLSEVTLIDILCVHNDGSKDNGTVYLNSTVSGFVAKQKMAVQRTPASIDEEEVTDDFDQMLLSSN